MELPNGWRYPLVGGTRERHFDGTNFKRRKLPENVVTPTSRVHALLGSFSILQPPLVLKCLETSIGVFLNRLQVHAYISHPRAM